MVANPYTMNRTTDPPFRSAAMYKCGLCGKPTYEARAVIKLLQSEPDNPATARYWTVNACDWCGEEYDRIWGVVYT